MKSSASELGLRVARSVAESNSTFLSALQTSQVLHISMNAQLTHESIVLSHFQRDLKRNSPATLQCVVHFGFATLQRSRLRLVKKLTGEFMRVNKLDFLKENTLFRNGKSKEELLRNNTTVSLTAKKLCFVGKLWFYQGDEQADGRI